MKKTITILALLLSLITSAQDLKFGAKAGVNFASQSGDVKGLSGRTTIHIGGVAEYEFKDNLSFQAELLYMGMGSKFEESFDGVTFEEIAKLNYIALPLLGKYYVTENIALEAGPQVAFLLSAESEFSGDGESGTEDTKEAYKGLDFGFNLGGSYTLDSGIFFTIRYTIGLANVADAPDSEDFSLSNNAFQISLGYNFDF